MQFLKTHLVLLLCLLVCSILRFLPLFEYQFTFDELSGLDRTQFSSLEDVLEKGVKIDAHPAFVQLLIYYLSQSFGYVNWIIKLPFLLFGHAAIIYAYFFCLRNFSKQAAIISVLIFSFSLIFVFYAPIARMYISGVFFSIVVLYHFFEIFFRGNSKISNYVMLGMFALLSAYNHHINSLFVFTIFASGIFFLDKKNGRKFIITALVAVLLYLPHLSITLFQLSSPGIGSEAGGWLEAPHFWDLFAFLKTLFGTGKVYILMVAFLTLAVILNGTWSLRKEQKYLFLIFFLNFLIVYFYSILRSPIFQYSVMLFSGTAFVLLFASFINFENKVLAVFAHGSIAAALLYQTYFHKDYLHQSVNAVYEYQFERTLHYKNLYGDDQVFPIFMDCDTLMRNIYFKKFNAKFDLKLSADLEVSNSSKVFYNFSSNKTPQMEQDSLISSIRLFSEFVSGLKCNFLAISSASPIYYSIVAEHFPYLLENTMTQGINYKLYSKKSQSKAIPSDRIIYTSSFKDPGHYLYPEEKLPLHVREENEFPFLVKTNYNTVIENEGNIVLVKTIVKLHSPATNAVEVCITATDRAEDGPYSYTSKSMSDFWMQQDSTLTLYSDLFIGRNHKQIKDKAMLNCYFWNRGKRNFDILDFEVTTIDYWPQKWTFWD